MRWRTVLLPVVICAAVVAYVLYPNVAARRAAAAVIANGRPSPWSSNERTLPALQEKVKAAPDDAEWTSALAQAYLQKARETGDSSYYAKADELFKRAIASAPGNVSARIGAGALAMARHDFARARDLAQSVVDTEPSNAASYGVLADALIELGEYDKAFQTLDTMIRRKPNLSSYSRIAYARELTGDIEGAIQTMRMAIEAGAPDGENTAWCMVQLGNLYLSDQRYAEAEQEYQMALSRFPMYVHAQAGLGRLAVARKDFPSAIHYYESAIERAPLPEFIHALAQVYESAGKPSDARGQYDLLDAIQKIYESNGVSMDIEMALYDIDRGQNLDHAVVVAKAEWSKRKSVRVADVYAWGLFRLGRYDEASQMMQPAMRLGSRDPMFLRHAEAIARVTSKK